MKFVNRNNSIDAALGCAGDFVVDAELDGAPAAGCDEANESLFRLHRNGCLHDSEIHPRTRAGVAGSGEPTDFRGKLKFFGP